MSKFDSANDKDNFTEYPGEDDDPPMPKCYACGGSGITVEGWDCEICDGVGELEI